MHVCFFQTDWKKRVYISPDEPSELEYVFKELIAYLSIVDMDRKRI